MVIETDRHDGDSTTVRAGRDGIEFETTHRQIAKLDNEKTPDGLPSGASFGSTSARGQQL